MKKKYSFLLAAVMVLSLWVVGQALAAGVTTYKIPVISDFTGGYAYLFKPWVPIQKAVFAWWNDTEGKKIGVNLDLKHYDGRYDPTVIASMWPGILADCKPIMGLGGGGPDIAALQQRFQRTRSPLLRHGLLRLRLAPGPVALPGPAHLCPGVLDRIRLVCPAASGKEAP